MGEGHGTVRKTRHRGLQPVGWQFTFTAAAYNLVRIPQAAGDGVTRPESVQTFENHRIGGSGRRCSMSSDMALPRRVQARYRRRPPSRKLHIGRSSTGVGTHDVTARYDW